MVDEGTCDDEASVATKTKTGNQSLGVAVLVRLNSEPACRFHSHAVHCPCESQFQQYPQLQYLCNTSAIQLLQCFVNYYRVTEAGGCSSSEHIEPTWCDDADAEGAVTRIDKVNFQCDSLKAAFLQKQRRNSSSCADARPGLQRKRS